MFRKIKRAHQTFTLYADHDPDGSGDVRVMAGLDASEVLAEIRARGGAPTADQLAAVLSENGGMRVGAIWYGTEVEI